MASASREIRRKRRVKRNLSVMTKLARTEMINRVKVTSVLLSVLAQQGGEVEISEETLNTTVNNLGKIQYVVEKVNPNTIPFDGRFAVRLVTTTDPLPTDEPVVEPVEPAEPVVESLAGATAVAFVRDAQADQE